MPDNLLFSRADASDIQREIETQFITLPTPASCVFSLIAWIGCCHRIRMFGQEKDQYPSWARKFITTTYNAIWNWVTKPRTHEEQLAILRMQCSCTDEDRDEPYHRTASNMYTKFRVAPGWQLVVMCVQVMQNAHDSGFVLLTKVHRRKHWPRSIQSSVPHGAAPTLEGICRWFNHVPPNTVRVTLFHGIYGLISVVGALVVPHIVECRSFLEGIYHISSAGRLLDKFQAEPGQQEEATVIGNLLQDCDGLTAVLSCLVTNVLNRTEITIFHQDSPARLRTAYDVVQRISGRAEELLNACTHQEIQVHDHDPMLDLGERLSRVNSRIRALKQRFYRHFPSGYASVPSLPRTRDRYNEEIQYTPSSSLPGVDEVIVSLVRMKDTQRCIAPLCLNTAVDIPLRLCMGCHSVSYCSRRCQKRGWNNDRVGHRLWCSSISELITEHVGLHCGLIAEISEESKTKARRLIQYLDDLDQLKMDVIRMRC
jgi:hypothetical protein